MGYGLPAVSDSGPVPNAKDMCRMVIIETSDKALVGFIAVLLFSPVGLVVDPAPASLYRRPPPCFGQKPHACRAASKTSARKCVTYSTHRFAGATIEEGCSVHETNGGGGPC